MRYHFNPETGRTGKCDATVKPCRFKQTEEEHGATPVEARANYERFMESELLPTEDSVALSEEAEPKIPSTDFNEKVELELDFATVELAPHALESSQGRAIFQNGLCGDLANSLLERNPARKAYFVVDERHSREELEAMGDAELRSAVLHGAVGGEGGRILDGNGVKTRESVEGFYDAKLVEVSPETMKRFSTGQAHKLAGFAAKVEEMEREGVAYRYWSEDEDEHLPRGLSSIPPSEGSVRVYHGSAARFDEFSYSTIGTTATSEGQGFYFTDSPVIARDYARANPDEDGYLYEADFKGKKSLSPTRMNIGPKEMEGLLNSLDDDDEYLSNWGDVEYEGRSTVVRRAVEGSLGGENDVDNVGSLVNSGADAKRIYRHLYERYGYDHLEVATDWGVSDSGEPRKVYVATVPEAFELRALRRPD